MREDIERSAPGDRRVRAVEIAAEGPELFGAAHIAAEPLAERMVADQGPEGSAQPTRLLTRLAQPDGGQEREATGRRLPLQ
ncbi:hypothetical protein ACIQ1J_22345 [Streptomyces sp. NPDC097107]|uniref:hypothetical protein n=1 Tax=Streptomyces sp. NPDC097107 TaxID=3366089 RepID=UPI00381822C5